MFSCRWTVCACLSATLLLAACGGDNNDDDGDGDGVVPGPCEVEPIPEACDQECSDSSPCPEGYFCGLDNTCDAECNASADQCAEGETCDRNGQCAEEPEDDGDTSDDGDEGECPSVQVDLTPIVPVVTLLIDQSGSMSDPFPPPDGPERWDALRDALIGTDDDGLLFDLQSGLTMGVALYTSHSGTQQGDPCPILQSVAPAINNAQAIATLLEGQGPDGDTPTAESVTAAAAAFPPSDNPRILVLATDGLPDRCDDPDAHEDPQTRTNVEVAVQNAFTAGLQTFVLSIGPELLEVEQHLQRVANAGQGLDLATGDAQFYTAINPTELQAQFEDIIGGARSCEIEVNGNVDLDRADEGTVVLNGTELEFETEWQLRDETTIVLLGDACNEFLAADQVSLSAEFPCGTVVVVP